MKTKFNGNYADMSLVEKCLANGAIFICFTLLSFIAFKFGIPTP